MNTLKNNECIRLYLDNVLLLKGYPAGLTPFILEFMRYAQDTDKESNVVFLNRMLKEEIASSLKVSVKRVEQAITELVKAGLFRRVGRSSYQCSPELFADDFCAETDNVVALFDFRNRTARVIPDGSDAEKFISSLPENRPE